MPQLLIEHESKIIMAELEQSIQSQGGKFENYLTSLNKTREQLILDMLPEAVKRVKTSLLVREIAEKENIKVEESELEKHIEEMKKHYKENKELMEKIDTQEYKNYVYNVLSSRKVIDKLREWNVK